MNKSAHSHTTFQNPEYLNAKLKNVVHFRDLSDADIKDIIATGKLQRHAKDSLIFIEGEPCAGLFVLLSGRVHLCKLSQNGQESILAVIEPVIMFNEVATLDGGPNAATALAVDDCLVWRAAPDRFVPLLLRYPTMALGLLRVQAARNRFLVSQFEDLSFRSVLARTAKLLLDLSNFGAHPIDRYKHPNKDLAARISTVPEAFSRSLRVFKNEGHITATRSHLIIEKPETLTHLAQIGPMLLDE